MLGLAGGLLLGACSFVVAPQTVQCETQQDCAGMGFPNATCVDAVCVASREDETPIEPVSEEPEEVDPRFACIERVWEQPGEGTVKYEMDVTELTGEAYPGLTVKVCPAFDNKCEKPLGETVTDAQGNFSLDLPVGFRGHLFAPAPESDENLMATEAYIFPPPSLDPSVPQRPGLVVTQDYVINGLARLDGAELVEGAGHVIFTAFGCDGKPLEGIEVTTSQTQDSTWRVYVGDGGHPDPKLKATGSTGKGAILNILPGFVKVTGKHPELGIIFEQSVVVTADRLTSVPVFPSPVPKS